VHRSLSADAARRNGQIWRTFPAQYGQACRDRLPTSPRFA